MNEHPPYHFDRGQLLASAALRGLTEVPDRWVTWRYEWRDKRWTKPPCRISGRFADSTDPSTWASFPDCAKAAEANGKLAGVGFVLSDDGVIALDVDACLDADREIVDRVAADMVARIDSYTEVSPSGAGLRVLVRGCLPELPNGKRGFKVLVGTTAVEVYAGARYVTLTGNRWGECPDAIEDAQPVLDWLVEMHARQQGEPLGHDAELRRHLDELLARDKKAAELWAGTASPSGPDKSRSAVMLALAGILARRLRWTRTQLTWALETWCDERGHSDKVGREVERTVAKVLGDVSREPPPAAPEIDLDGLVERAGEDPGAAFEGEAIDFLARLRATDQAAYQRARARLKTKKVRVSELDREIAARAPAEPGENRPGRPLEFPEIEPWPQPVDGAALLDAMATHLQRFAVMPSIHAVTATVLWPLHGHALDAATHTPRLLVTSPTPECGKSQVMEWLAGVVPKPFDVIDPTGPTLFRPIEAHSPTVLIDEGDLVSWDERRDVRMVINAGHNRLSPGVPRTVGDDFETRVFRVWAPLAFSMIGKPLHTQLSRSIVIDMKRMTGKQKVEHRRSDRDQGFAEIRRKCARWALDHTDELRNADPEMPVTGRKANCWRPLIAIADVIGGEWPTKARAAAIALSADDHDAETIGVELLGTIKGVFDSAEAEAIWTEDLLRYLHDLTEAPWCEYGRMRKPITPRQLASLLKPFGITSRQIRQRDTNKNGFERSQFIEVWSRYSTGLQATESAEDSDFVSSTSESSVEDRNPPKATESASCRGVEDRHPPTGGKTKNSPTECIWCHEPIEPAAGYTATSEGERLHNRCVDEWSKT